MAGKLNIWDQKLIKMVEKVEHLYLDFVKKGNIHVKKSLVGGWMDGWMGG